MNEILRNGCVLLGMAFLPACQSQAPVESLNLTLPAKPLPIIVSIGKTMQKCWFKGGGFAAYRMSDESNSYSGRPRLLLVPKKRPTGLPSLVIQAQANKGKSDTTLQVYGPLLATSLGKRINEDIRRWSGGNYTCKAS